MEYTLESIQERIDFFEDLLPNHSVTNIGILLDAREKIAVEMAFFGKTATDLLLQMKIKDAYYRQQRSIIILGESVVSRGEAKASKATPEIKMDYIRAEVLHTRVKNHLSYLYMRNDIFNQKISHLKKEWEIKHLNR